MQHRRFLQLAACVLVLIGSCFASSMNDPKVIIGGGGSPTLNTPDTFTVIGNTFSFSTATGTTPPCTVNNQNDPDCSFINGNNYTWTSLTFIMNPTQGNLSCDGTFFFAGCSVNNQLGIITFTQCQGDVCGSGVGPGGFFLVEAQGFAAPTSFNVTANQVPEPASLVLMLTGAAAFLRRRRKQ